VGDGVHMFVVGFAAEEFGASGAVDDGHAVGDPEGAVDAGVLED